MRIKRSAQVSGAFLTVLALCALIVAPAQAASGSARAAVPAFVSSGATTSVNAHVYLTGQILQPMFQASLNQSMPQMVSGVLSSMVSQMPKQDQGWATQMAGALLQPSATLVSLQPQAGGLLTTFRVNLYAGDPKPITTNVLIGFKVLNASTVQVTALPSANGQSLVSGPLTTFTVPIGSLNSIAVTPQCGDANLSINLKFPLALGQASAATPTGNSTTTKLDYTRSTQSATNTQLNFALPADHTTNSYIELPAASLAQLGGSMGTMQISSSITAQNIRVSVQGSNLLTTSDIHWHGVLVGVAVSTMAPGSANGNLVVHVLKTDFQIFDDLFSFPMNNYNQQIQQDLNTELTGALTGTFSVNQAAIGPNPHLTCAATNSLVLAGAITLG
jgi:hypothetical protein